MALAEDNGHQQHQGTTRKLIDLRAGRLRASVGGTGKHLKIGRLTFVLPKRSRLHIFCEQQYATMSSSRFQRSV